MPVIDLTGRMSSGTEYAEECYRIENARSYGFIVGLDLGKSQDFTALIVNDLQWCERVRYARTKFQPIMEPIGRRRVMRHQLVNLHRYPKGTAYPDIYRSVKSVLTQLPQRERYPELVVDGTGVGAPVVDAMREMAMHPISITITGGRTINKISSAAITVPKTLLASAVDIVLAEDRLDITMKASASMPLKAELQGFRVKIRATGTEALEAWREGTHDDLVLATALAVWRGEGVSMPISWPANWMAR